MNWKVAILTASDRGFKGEKEDTCAQVIRELVEEEILGYIIEYRVVPDEKDEIMAALIEMADYHQADLILTTGGIGISNRDVTPEATLAVVDRLVPGIAETIRYSVMQKSAKSMFTRSVSGIRGKSLIINLPGSPQGVNEYLQPILAQLPFALAVLNGMDMGQDGELYL
jgi:molybdopterin adenylyltransferase